MTALGAGDKLKEGDKAPNFTLPTDNNKEISLSGLKGKKVIVYFYPKDSTPGCTKEACEFRDNLNSFQKLGTEIIGLSKDSVKKHDNFKEKNDLNFPLASDEAGAICEKYGVWVEKNMYGRKYMGIERATFLIGENGKILKIWRKVKVAGHVEDILSTIEDIEQAAA